MVIDIMQELINLGYDYETEGNDTAVTQFSSITEAKNNDLAFCYYEGEKAIGYITASNAGIILCKKTMIGKVHPKNGQQFFF
jgi:UDP-3-O-[3-hydroxymyristoyl] glucosamine N-acyltransferase